jgi:CDP-glycerol glycerophosphotransferase
MGAVPTPTVSVVVPIYQVERYLAECLASIARQSVPGLEVVMVDDGSTDGGPAIAERFASRDPRFRLIGQANGGLGKARNTGIAAATGEYLAFVDSDDVLPPGALERLLASLRATGSDFATGNVLRLTGRTTAPAAFLARSFTRTRRRTHVSRFRPLLADRVAWNKLWRRSFWDEHGLRFPEGVVHEDIPVVLPAHFLARAVDVLATPVYHYRMREGGELSITQRRLEERVLHDRLNAVEHVARFLTDTGRDRERRWYEQSVVGDDLRLHLNVLDEADDGYRAAFLDRVNAFLDGAPPDVFDHLRAIDRLKWHLVRRRLVPELLEVLRFQKDEMAGRPPVRRGLRRYGDYPFRADPRLGIPPATYRLRRRDQDLSLVAQLDDLRWDGARFTLTGRAHVNGLGAPEARSQRARIALVRPGRWQRVLSRLAPRRLRTRAVHRPELPERLAWSGFEAVLDPGALRRAPATWVVHATVRAGLVFRRRARFVVEPGPPAAAFAVVGGTAVRVASDGAGRVTVVTRRRWALVREHRVTGEHELELTGDLRMAAAPELEAVRATDGLALTFPVTVEVERFTARIDLAALRAAPPAHLEPSYRPGEEVEWELWLAASDGRVRLALPAPGPGWRHADRAGALVASDVGDAALVEQVLPARVSG